ncbi:MAG: S8 family serine peptidase [Acidobacteria bacterium]|nr:S8 family serine peptidase [Acidobacteriota bacterium]MCI0628103.1 S8 family serine peptidase [Acidobacteriota bacterium]MCI0719769.1 S8 family serine peptidase [Acidobacteriota bacterium]
MGSGHPYKYSPHGPEVTISAPGHQVWAGDFGSNGSAIVKPGSGTSYSTPHVAAAAAAWLSYHGRQNLLDRYDGQASWPLSAVGERRFLSSFLQPCIEAESLIGEA